MRKFVPLLAALGLVTLPVAAAESLDYRYFDAALVGQDGPGDDLEGLGARFSLPFTPQFYGKAAYSATSLDGVDRTDLSVGGGYRVPLNRTTDFFAEIDFLDVDVEQRSDSGLRLGAGVRSRVAEQLELRGALRYVDLGDGELAVDLGAQYLLTDAWAGFVEMTEADDFGGYRIGARYHF